jgi:uncharacterized integral membrane protein
MTQEADFALFSLSCILLGALFLLGLFFDRAMELKKETERRRKRIEYLEELLSRYK